VYPRWSRHRLVIVATHTEQSIRRWLYVIERCSSTASADRRQFLGEVWVKAKGLAALASANPSSFMVAGARFELWKRPLIFNFLMTY
jgi:hypothetical protein